MCQQFEQHVFIVNYQCNSTKYTEAEKKNRRDPIDRGIVNFFK